MQSRIAGFMSGKGTNLRKIIEFERKYKMEKGSSPYEVVMIFSDTYNSNAPEIGKDYNIPVVIRDIKSFYISKGKPIHDMETRAEFDKRTIEAISPYNVSIIAYAGYMSIVSDILVKTFTGINIHPADLSILDQDGNRKYTGVHATENAIRKGEIYIRSTTHLLTKKMDGGPIFMISEPFKIIRETAYVQFPNMNTILDINQSGLKEVGDYIIFPLTLRYLSEGRFSLDDEKNIFFDGKKIPYGLRLES